jgi:hypothetical protein
VDSECRKQKKHQAWRSCAPENIDLSPKGKKAKSAEKIPGRGRIKNDVERLVCQKTG